MSRTDTDFDTLESAIRTAQNKLELVEEALDEAEQFGPDIEDLEDRLKAIEDATDAAADDQDPTLLSNGPALINYVQALAENLSEQADAAADELDEFETAAEAVEDHLKSVDIGERTKWFARVNGLPLLYDERVVEARRLIEGGRNPDAPSDYTLLAFTSAVDEEPDAEFSRGDMEVDLDDFTEFETERSRGGGQV